MTEFDRQMAAVADEVMREVAGQRRVSHNPSDPGYGQWVNIKKKKNDKNMDKDEMGEEK